MLVESESHRPNLQCEIVGSLMIDSRERKRQPTVPLSLRFLIVITSMHFFFGSYQYAASHYCPFNCINVSMERRIMIK
jgi:hypothetical protein